MAIAVHGGVEEKKKKMRPRGRGRTFKAEEQMMQRRMRGQEEKDERVYCSQNRRKNRLEIVQ